MQNRFVADIGDYVKLAILRALARDRSLGVVWWLFPMSTTTQMAITGNTWSDRMSGNILTWISLTRS